MGKLSLARVFRLLGTDVKLRVCLVTPCVSHPKEAPSYILYSGGLWQVLARRVELLLTFLPCVYGNLHRISLPSYCFLAVGGDIGKQATCQPAGSPRISSSQRVYRWSWQLNILLSPAQIVEIAEEISSLYASRLPSDTGADYPDKTSHFEFILLWPSGPLLGHLDMIPLAAFSCRASFCKSNLCTSSIPSTVCVSLCSVLSGAWILADVLCAR